MNSAEIRQLMEDQLELSGQLRGRIRDLEQAARAPVAVLGMGLRFPGGIHSPDEYWDFLRGDATVLSGVPEDRPGLRAVYDPVPGNPGRSYVDRAGFLTDIASFDADFFGISQREAELLDPQQRLLLLTAWEALERAGIAVRRADRLNVGVYLGMMASEYGERLAVRADKTPIDPYYATGGGLCFGAGRISYVMGFRGPALSVDTACSSSLTALHLAVRALRSGECRYALVCGSNLLLSGNLMVSLCQSRALAPDGRSKSFLDAADGYGRGEGVGVLVLMRLAEAEREKHPILAVVRGTAVNHDGAASGLTVPNGPAQQEVIRGALADADIAAKDLGWIEAHGTGTRLGDPTELGALDGVVGAAIRERGIPLAIGSVKSRLGHLEAASGIAALMKTTLMLQHGLIPPAAGEDDGELNTHIPWDRLGFTVPRRAQPWPESLSRRVAGVNSFGMSGTNAHAVLEAYLPHQDDADRDDANREDADQEGADQDHPAARAARHELLVLSAKDPAALAELADAAGGYLRKAADLSISSFCHTYRSGRTLFSYRLAVTGATAAELADRLAAAAQSALPVPGVAAVTLRLTPRGGRVAAGLAEMARAFPRIAAVLLDAPADPGEMLAFLLGQLGLRVRLQPDPALTGPAALLEWQVGGGPGTCSAPLISKRVAGADVLLLDVLARLLNAGADLRLSAVQAPGARLLGDLPTYPFRGKRFWIDEVAVAQAGTAAASGGGPPPPHDPDGVAAYLMAELRDLLHATEELDPAKSFLDSGGDSYIATLYMTKVEARFSVGLTPEDLPLDLPLNVLIGRLGEHVTGAARPARRVHGG